MLVNITRAPQNDGLSSPTLFIAVDEAYCVVGALTMDGSFATSNLLNRWLQQIVDLVCLDRELAEEELVAVVDAARNGNHPLHCEIHQDEQIEFGWYAPKRSKSPTLSKAEKARRIFAKE